MEINRICDFTRVASVRADLANEESPLRQLSVFPRFSMKIPDGKRKRENRSCDAARACRRKSKRACIRPPRVRERESARGKERGRFYLGSDKAAIIRGSGSRGPCVAFHGKKSLGNSVRPKYLLTRGSVKKFFLKEKFQIISFPRFSETYRRSISSKLIDQEF